MLVSIELVPRSKEDLLRDITIVENILPQINVLNVPDLLRFDLRSYEAASFAYSEKKDFNVIPHIRAIDIAPDAPLPCVDRPEIKEVLVVAGDPPPTEQHEVYPNTSVDIIKRYQKEAPHLRVYAVFDPYRRSPKEELEELERKKEAGASGFFTQPIFDTNLLQLSMDWLRDETVFWGISPVLGEKSRRYWERVNNIVFPKEYDFSLEGNIHFAQRMLQLVKQQNDNAYLMPLRVDLGAYLTELQSFIVY
ncbi:methylenetetrahydrofolate reductase [Swingsia samuiensis]|uniref:Methylenetetrahydrofolate reductase n=1 Tax=Swingsia samuiensis TaxID=1293412 RepID=A0A4Y6UJ22_9PROT|nr:methylenetetrahydrofolate reductase [Swingsia samuiensis]QDH17064.1 methylenetetrahydrofolate reductase [Swingsia samuiensis]